ncbi:MAG: hypothetical protein JWP66_1821 [Naasia sp.]|nr:hypothetical protein [Naasia sp.]
MATDELPAIRARIDALDGRIVGVAAARQREGEAATPSSEARTRAPSAHPSGSKG